MRGCLIIVLLVGSGVTSAAPPKCHLKDKPGSACDGLASDLACFSAGAKCECQQKTGFSYSWHTADGQDTSQPCQMVQPEHRCYDMDHSVVYHEGSVLKSLHPLCPRSHSANCKNGKSEDCKCQELDTSKACQRESKACHWVAPKAGQAKMPQPCEVLDPDHCYLVEKGSEHLGKPCPKSATATCTARDDARSSCQCLQTDEKTCASSKGCTWHIDGKKKKDTNQACVAGDRSCQADGAGCGPEYRKVKGCANSLGEECKCMRKPSSSTTPEPCEQSGLNNKDCTWHAHALSDDEGKAKFYVSNPDLPCHYTKLASDTQCTKDGKPGVPCPERVEPGLVCNTATGTYGKTFPCSCLGPKQEPCKREDDDCAWFYNQGSGSYVQTEPVQPCNVRPDEAKQCFFQYKGKAWSCDHLEATMPCHSHRDARKGQPCHCHRPNPKEEYGKWRYGPDSATAQLTDPPQVCHQRLGYDPAAHVCRKDSAQGRLCRREGDYNCRDADGMLCLCHAPDKDTCTKDDAVCFFVTRKDGVSHQPCAWTDAATAASASAPFPPALLPILVVSLIV